jgi:RNA polymerase sigma-70 factor, ECF subfamily
VSQTGFDRRYCFVNAPHEVAADLPALAAGFDFEALFRAQYARIAGLIARVVRDQARAEELAVEVFLKLSRDAKAQNENAGAWLYRAAARMALDELRRRTRRQRYESLLGLGPPALTPEEIHLATEEREKIRQVMSAIAKRQAEILLLRSDGLSYLELALALQLNPASVGTLLSRAQQAFRKEYVKRYGKRD